MMQQIMVYAMAVAATLGLAALGMERFAALHRLPRRTAWAAALLLSVLVPVLMILRAEPVNTTLPVPVSAVQNERVMGEMPAPRTPDHTFNASQSPASQFSPARRTWHFPQLSDGLLLQGWAIASLLSGLYLIGANLRLRRRLSGWRPTTLLGHPVLISESMGPALAGVLQPRMVIPRWLLDAPVTTQTLILEHERQHVAAHDPLLIRAAVVLLAALPWNLPLWWQWRRLRQAIELDCDARVLRAGAEPQTYGEVLLAVTGRAASLPAGVVAMSEPVSALERRIQGLLPDPVRRAALQSTAAVALLVAGIGFAVAMSAPAIPQRAPAKPAAPQTTAAAMHTAPAVSRATAATPATALPPTQVLAAAAAAPAAAPAPRAPESVQTAPATTTAALPGFTEGQLEMAMRAAVQKYPELIDGPPLNGGFYYATIIVRADGTLYRSTLRATPLPMQAPGLPQLGRTFEQVIATSNTAKIVKGQLLADLGTASNDVEMLWRVLPADYDESRDSRRVTEIVRATRNHLMLWSIPQELLPKMNLLTVLMTEDGQIAREAVERLDRDTYRSLQPQPVNGEAIVNATGAPYTAYNPPSVPVEAFGILGVDPEQIGQTGFLLVTRDATIPGSVMVRYAWPRRPGEPIGGKAQ